MRYLVEASGGGESPFVYESDTEPKLGDTIVDRPEGAFSHGYIVRFIEPGREDFDGVIKAEFAWQSGPAQARSEP